MGKSGLAFGQLGQCGQHVREVGGDLRTELSGVFHVFDDADRVRYVSSLASVLREAGSCYLICFSDRQPGTLGPRRVRQDEIRAAFSDGWSITSIEAAEFELNQSGLGIPFAQAWLAAIQRVNQP
jgi:hypothetical protein